MSRTYRDRTIPVDVFMRYRARPFRHVFDAFDRDERRALTREQS